MTASNRDKGVSMASPQGIPVLVFSRVTKCAETENRRRKLSGGRCKELSDAPACMSKVEQQHPTTLSSEPPTHRTASVLARKTLNQLKGRMFRSILILLLCFGMVSVKGQTTSAPSIVPDTASPSLSTTRAPTSSPYPTSEPTPIPSRAPSISPRPTPAPTLMPTNVPTQSPSSAPSRSSMPSLSAFPSLVPTITTAPSNVPSVSLEPSAQPTNFPTSSAPPSTSPSHQPTNNPTVSPSDVPSSVPSRVNPFIAEQNFLQPFLVPGDQIFNSTESDLLMMLFESYTYVFAPDSIRVETQCNLTRQKTSECAIDDPQCNIPGLNNTGLDLFVNNVEYFCSWISTVTDVMSYPDNFTTFVNGDRNQVKTDMQALGLNVTAVLPVRDTTPDSQAPTFPPSVAPSLSPSTTPAPSFRPSPGPTRFRSKAPTFRPSKSPEPSVSGPTSPSSSSGSSLSVGAISAIVILAGLAVLGGLVVFYRRLKKNRDMYMASTTATTEVPNGRGKETGTPGIWEGAAASPYEGDSDMGVALISPSESLVSKQSLLSAGGSGLGDESDHEADGTRNLQDEFDQYKDQNLEEFRSDVEGNLAGFDGIMSAAVTRALMGDDYPVGDKEELFWGFDGNPTGPEIEASALCEVSDWLKRKESATVEQKRAFMQDLLNRMVASVRSGVLRAEDASRTIHECAALLGLQLANELPMTTVIISGMRKTANAAPMLRAMREFGEIDIAAVASKQRGFGIVRFRNPKSVDRAMRRYRSGEIVVQDVAVQMKVLMPSGLVEGRIS